MKIAEHSMWRRRLATFGARELIVDVRLWAVLCILIAVAVRLGLWQLDRADEKGLLQNRMADRIAMRPIPCAEAVTRHHPDQAAFVRVAIDGQFDPQAVFLMDNRTKAGVAGYQVVSVLHCADGSRLLVDRGWVPVGRDRSVLPDVAPPPGAHELIGFVYVPIGLGTVLESTVPAGWPKVVSLLDEPTLALALPDAIYPYRVVLESESVQRLASLRASQTTPSYNAELTRIDRSKHLGYAVQWAGIALGIFGWGIFASIKRRTPQST